MVVALLQSLIQVSENAPEQFTNILFFVILLGAFSISIVDSICVRLIHKHYGYVKNLNRKKSLIEAVKYIIYGKYKYRW